MFDLKEYRRQYYQAHKEERREYNKEYYQDNIEKFREKNKRWQKEHPEYRKENYKKNKEKIYESQTKYRHNNSKKVAQMVSVCRKRRVERLRAEGIINPWAVISGKSKPKYRKEDQRNG